MEDGKDIFTNVNFSQASPHDLKSSGESTAELKRTKPSKLNESDDEDTIDGEKQHRYTETEKVWNV